MMNIQHNNEGNINVQHKKRGGFYIFSILIVLVSSLIVLAPELGQENILLEILGQYRLQLVFLLFIPFLTFVLKRYYLLASIQIICVLTCSFFILTAYSAEGASQLCSSDSQEKSIRVLSFNSYYMNLEYEEIVEMIEEINADIVLLLEAKSGLYHHAHDRLYKRYPFYYADIEKGVEQGKSFYSKYPIENLEIKKLRSFSRTVLQAQINVDGTFLDFIGLHAYSPKNIERIRDRNTHITALSDYIQGLNASEEAVIVAGDFNTTPWHPVMRQFKEETGLNNGTIYNIMPTWPSWLPSFLAVPIDHIFYSDTFINSIYYKGLPSGSDHYPIYVDLEFCK